MIPRRCSPSSCSQGWRWWCGPWERRATAGVLVHASTLTTMLFALGVAYLLAFSAFSVVLGPDAPETGLGGRGRGPTLSGCADATDARERRGWPGGTIVAARAQQNWRELRPCKASAWRWRLVGSRSRSRAATRAAPARA